jgi:alkaline phosphatase D
VSASRALGRRAFLAGLLGAAAVPGCAPLPGAPGHFTFGPAAVEATDTSALIWLRPSREGRGVVEYGPDPALADARATAPVAATRESDLTVAVPLTGLAPGREHFYRGVLLPAGRGEPVRGARGRFRTAPDRAEAFRFAWSADMEASQQPFTLLDRAVERDPHFFLMLGDTMYADIPRERADLSLEGYRAKHRENRADPHLGRLLASTGVFAIWDDHEVENDFHREHPRLAEGLQAFREYWPVRTPAMDPRVLYRRVPWGPAADLFILDCRQYRSPQREPDGPAKTMLGATQKAWFKEAIRASRAPFKFVVTSVPFTGPWGPDRWDGYATEREELRRFLTGHRLTGGLVFLSGDVHLAIDIDVGDGLREFVAGPIGAWPACRIRPQARQLLAASGRAFVCDAFTFGLVTVRPEASPPEATVEIVDAEGAVRIQAVVRAR